LAIYRRFSNCDLFLKVPIIGMESVGFLLLEMPYLRSQFPKIVTEIGCMVEAKKTITHHEYTREYRRQIYAEQVIMEAHAQATAALQYPKIPAMSVVTETILWVLASRVFQRAMSPIIIVMTLSLLKILLNPCWRKVHEIRPKR
jgi:hypothetical protein